MQTYIEGDSSIATSSSKKIQTIKYQMEIAKKKAEIEANMSCFNYNFLWRRLIYLFIMKGRSTITNLVEFSNFVIDKIENGRQVDGVYTDFSKAFDRVSHCLLYINLSKNLEGSMLCSQLFKIRTSTARMDR
jgi:hypothetical protein